jgi:hypothetical protein
MSGAPSDGMTGDGGGGGSLCREVFERLVTVQGSAGDGPADPRQDPALAAHLGTCMSCFRVLSEMRDAPRIAALLRDEPPPAEMPAPDDPFWDQLAARTTAAAGAATAGSLRGEARIPRSKEQRRPGRFAAFALGAAMAAAAAWVAVVHGPLDRRGPAVTAGGSAALEQATAAAEVEDPDDVDDLDVEALRRLLDRLQAAPAVEVTALVEGDSDLFFDDDDGALGDELVDLDRPALLRVERSFEGAL